MPYTLDQLNAMAEVDFVTAVGPAFEETPAIAAQVWAQRPFTSVADLHQRMVAIAQALSAEDKLALIKAHPDLGTQVAMAEASVVEQSKAGLNTLNAEEYELFQRLNLDYKNKFGFPFILAVTGHTKVFILENFDQRLRNSTDEEISTALLEIETIARSRLEAWIQGTSSPSLS